MAEMTEREVQEMIQKAREGDAEANFRMSEWALEQAVAEPEEERWNRLAAKCLVKSAEAGYAPAKARMDELIRQLEEEKTAPAPAPREPEPEQASEAPRYERTARRPAAEPEEEPEPRAASSFDFKAAASGAAAAVVSVAGKAVSYIKELFRSPDEGEAAPAEEKAHRQAAEARPAAASGAKHAGSKHSGGLPAFLRFNEWTDAQWKKAQKICLIVCVILVILILILVFSGKSKKAREPEATPALPVAETTAPVEPTATPEVKLYPDETVRAAIAAAGLEVAPTDIDYVTEPTTATVKTNGSDLSMRKGPATTYDRITMIPRDTVLDVYAKKSGWALVNYNGSYGWCSSEYLK